ncbi:MAG: hypothetical protein WCX17_00615 [Parcubacteria group bacterium]|jgi:hypothetical protein
MLTTSKDVASKKVVFDQSDLDGIPNILSVVFAETAGTDFQHRAEVLFERTGAMLDPIELGYSQKNIADIVTSRVKIICPFCGDAFIGPCYCLGEGVISLLDKEKFEMILLKNINEQRQVSLP